MNAKEKSKKRRTQSKQTPLQPEQVQPAMTQSSPKKKRITFDVHPDLHKKTCLLVSRQGITIKDLLTTFLEQETVNEEI